METPCLNPLELPKKSQGEPLIKMEKQIVDKIEEKKNLLPPLFRKTTIL